MRQPRCANWITIFALVSIWGSVAGAEAPSGAEKGAAAPSPRSTASVADRSASAPSSNDVSGAKDTPVPVKEKAVAASATGTSVRANADATGDRRPARASASASESQSRRTAPKPRGRRSLDPSRAVAYAPNFEMKIDGSSTVTVHLSQLVPVEPMAAKSKRSSRRVLEYVIKGAQIGVRNNTNPLVTEHFQTPLQRVVLKPEGHNARLTLVFREDVTVKPVVVPGQSGTAVVQFAIPAATRAYSVAPARKVPVPKNDDE